MILINLSIHNFVEKKLIKEYRFKEFGLNVILGDKRDDEDDTNGVGKSNFIKYIHFLLGRDYSKEKIPSILLENNIFVCLKIHYENQFIQLARLVTDQGHGYILEDTDFSYDFEKWEKLSNKGFRDYVNDRIGSPNSDVTFAALREYLIRDEKRGYSSIIHKGRGATLQHKIFLSLFNLPNYFEEEINKITKIVNALSAEKSLISSYQKPPQRLLAEKDEITAEIILLENQIKELDLRDFSAKNGKRYSENKEKINKINSAIYKIEYMTKQFEKNIKDLDRRSSDLEKLNDLESFYKQLTNYFPEQITRNFNEVQKFYKLMKNDRGNFFKDKIKENNIELQRLSKEKNTLEKELAEYTKVLTNTKFIEDISSIQRRLSAQQEKLAEINVRISDFERINDLNIAIQEIKLNRSKEIAKYHSRFKSFNEQITEINNIFKQIIQTTYGESAAYISFVYDNNDKMNGTPGRIKIESYIPEEESHGRHNAKIRAVDLSGLLYRVRNKLPLTFLIHDGSFSVTDNSKNFKMLQFAHENLIREQSGQYIVTLNRKDLSEEALNYFISNKLIIADLKKDKDNNRFFGFGWSV